MFSFCRRESFVHIRLLYEEEEEEEEEEDFLSLVLVLHGCFSAFVSNFPRKALFWFVFVLGSSRLARVVSFPRVRDNSLVPIRSFKKFSRVSNFLPKAHGVFCVFSRQSFVERRAFLNFD